MTFLRAATAAALALGLAACGSSEPKPAATTRTAAPAAKPVNAEPKGRLSPPEYRSVRAAYKITQPLERSNDIAKAVRLAGRACLRLTTQTELLAALHADCFQTLRFARALREMVVRKAECTRAGQAGDVSCFAELFRSLGRTARVGAVRGAQVNAVLRKRRIHGACSAVLGTKKKDLAMTHEIVHDALGAAHAMEARNQGSFLRAANQLQVDLDARGHTSSYAKTTRQLRRCL